MGGASEGVTALSVSRPRCARSSPTSLLNCSTSRRSEDSCEEGSDAVLSSDPEEEEGEGIGCIGRAFLGSASGRGWCNGFSLEDGRLPDGLDWVIGSSNGVTSTSGDAVTAIMGPPVVKPEGVAGESWSESGLLAFFLLRYIKNAAEMRRMPATTPTTPPAMAAALGLEPAVGPAVSDPGSLDSSLNTL